MKSTSDYIIRKRKGMDSILDRLPGDIARSLRGLPVRVLDELEEIRFRVNRPVIVYSGGREYEVARMGSMIVAKEEIEKIFSLLMHHSTYSYQDEIRSGYITLDGGHRVGICGKVITEGDRVISIRDVSSINIRRGCEHPGIADEVIPYLFDGSNNIRNTLIVSPPKCGKTTVLRDVIRNLSNRGYKTGVCDERSEIAGCAAGVPGFDIGSRTDVMDGCSKDIGITMLIRSMSPDIIAVDELGSVSDARAAEQVTVAGISLIATMHGKSYEDAVRSPLGGYIKNGTISRIVILSSDPTPGTVTDILNSANLSLLGQTDMKWE